MYVSIIILKKIFKVRLFSQICFVSCEINKRSMFMSIFYLYGICVIVSFCIAPPLINICENINFFLGSFARECIINYLAAINIVCFFLSGLLYNLNICLSLNCFNPFNLKKCLSVLFDFVFMIFVFLEVKLGIYKLHIFI